MRKNEDLKAEYLLIQNQYEAFDQRALSLKALATPLLGAGVALGISAGRDSILHATILVAGSLWILEAIWKGFQYCLTDRIKLLEAWFRGEGREEEPPFQIYTAWGQVYQRDRLLYMLTRMGLPFVFLPYLVVILVCTTIIATR